jgi:site-specific recombinase XerD
MAKVNLRQRGRIWYLDYRHNGKRIVKSCKTDNRKYAELLRSKAEKELFVGILDPSAKPAIEPITIDRLFVKFVTLAEKTRSAESIRVTRWTFKMWSDHFKSKGVVMPDQITPGIINDYHLDSDVGGHAFNNRVQMLKTALNKAVEWGHLKENPIKGVKFLKTPKKLRLFSREELEKLDGKADDMMRLVISLGVYAGLRCGEMTSLRWDDVDLKRDQLTIRSGGDFTPKGQRPRSIPLHQKLKGILAAVGNREGWVLTGDKPYSPHNLSVQFTRLRRKAGVGGRLHDLRHTFGSGLVRAGVPLPVVKDLMGHSRIETTMIYVHVTPDQYRKAIDSLEL